jgi:hypothetical protein
VPPSIGSRDVEHQLQIRELHPERSRGGPKARAIIGIIVDLPEHLIEDLLELLLRQ